MKMIDHNHFICHLILGTFTEYPLKDFPLKYQDILFSSYMIITRTGLI